MQVEISHSPFEIIIEEKHEWTKRPSRHIFFELVYILEGSGYQCINSNTFEYKQSNVFLLPPLGCHSFKIVEPTRFAFIRFTNQYLKKDLSNIIDYEDWFNKVSYILISYNKIPGDIIRSIEDKKHIISFMKVIKYEYERKDGFSEDIVKFLIISVLNILTRNIESSFMSSIESLSKDCKFQNLINYIQHNLFRNDKIKLKNLAEQFDISKTYIGEFFKKNAGNNLQDYILKSRLKVIESILLYSGNSIKEIAHDFGFTDASHLSRIFKKYYGVTINEYRERGNLLLLSECNSLEFKN